MVIVISSAAAISGPLRRPKAPTGERRPIVHAIDLLDAELVQQPVVDHRHRARAAFLGGLEDDDRRCRRNRASRARRRAAPSSIAVCPS